MDAREAARLASSNYCLRRYEEIKDLIEKAAKKGYAHTYADIPDDLQIVLISEGYAISDTIGTSVKISWKRALKSIS